MKNTIGKYTSDQPVVEKLREQQQQLEQMKAIQPPTIRLSSLASADITISNNTAFTITATLESPGDQVLNALPEVTILKAHDDLAADAWPSGANWSNSDKANFDVQAVLNLALTDSKNLVYSIVLVNKTGSSIDVRFYIRWRYITPGATA